MWQPSASSHMNGPLEWLGAIGAIIAAAMIASDLGRKWTGWAFVLFCGVSVAWIISGLQSDSKPLAIQNGILLLINGWGVWQYLLSKKNKRIMEREEELHEQAVDEVEAGKA